MQYERERGSPSKRGYGRTWQRLRLMVLRAEPLCRACGAQGVVRAAMDVDHIIPKARGGADLESNLQPLCHAHHSAKTVAEGLGFGG